MRTRKLKGRNKWKIDKIWCSVGMDLEEGDNNVTTNSIIKNLIKF